MSTFMGHHRALKRNWNFVKPQILVIYYLSTSKYFQGSFASNVQKLSKNLLRRLRWGRGTVAYPKFKKERLRNIENSTSVVLDTNKSNFEISVSSVIRQKGESQNKCFKKTKHAKLSEK